MKTMKRIIIVALVIVAAGAVAYYFFAVRHNTAEIQYSFPAYFPREMISDSYLINLEILADAVRLPTEQHRVSVSYISHLKFVENEKGFKDYFDKNSFKWSIIDSVDSRFIVAEKEKTNISITLWKQLPERIAILYIVNK